MIIDSLLRLEAVVDLPGPFADAVGFLRRPDLETLADGRYEAGRRGVYATVSRGPARHAQEGRLEAHRRHADVQVLLDGRESVGWLPLAEGVQADSAYDPAADVQFFAGAPQFWVHLSPGQFVLLMPADAHLPLVGEGLIHKVVVKVPLAGGWSVDGLPAR